MVTKGLEATFNPVIAYEHVSVEETSIEVIALEVVSTFKVAENPHASRDSRANHKADKLSCDSERTGRVEYWAKAVRTLVPHMLIIELTSPS